MNDPTPEPDPPPIDYADLAEGTGDADYVDDPGGFDGRFLVICIAVLVGLITLVVAGWIGLSYLLSRRHP